MIRFMMRQHYSCHPLTYAHLSPLPSQDPSVLQGPIQTPPFTQARFECSKPIELHKLQKRSFVAGQAALVLTWCFEF